MDLYGILSFTESGVGADMQVVSGDGCWTASYPTLADAIAAAFVNNLVDIHEACDAFAVESHMVPWVKPVNVEAAVLTAMGLNYNSESQKSA